MDAAKLLREARRAQRALLREAVAFVLGNLHRPAVRRTRHFQEWLRCPMNYARTMELPLTMLMLHAQPKERLLDVSSPKLLSLCYARWGFRHLVAADVEDYFVADFEAYARHAGVEVETNVFDATRPIPYPEEHFDKAFSVSVLEHIPHDGDGKALSRIARVLKDAGRLVLTLPAFPRYVEEWVSPRRIYWSSVKNADGRVFYQRRYDRDALYDRLRVDGLSIESVVLVAEKPLEQPRLSDDGLMLHNSYWVDRVPAVRLLRAPGWRMRRVPFADYLAESLASRRCHYLTNDWNDPNIRQVVVSMTKEKRGVSAMAAGA